jgi:hypothetical protein
MPNWATSSTGTSGERRVGARSHWIATLPQPVTKMGFLHRRVPLTISYPFIGQVLGWSTRPT